MFSTNQARRKRGTPWETPTKHSLVVAMSVEELRLLSQNPAEISLETLDVTTTSTFREADNTFYFTREQFAGRLCFPVLSLAKQFLHFTRALPALVHSNSIRILMDCSVLNSLYQLDISLVKICFIYTLKLRIEAICPCRPIVPQL